MKLDDKTRYFIVLNKNAKDMGGAEVCTEKDLIETPPDKHEVAYEIKIINQVAVKATVVSVKSK